MTPTSVLLAASADSSSLWQVLVTAGFGSLIGGTLALIGAVISLRASRATAIQVAQLGVEERRQAKFLEERKEAYAALLNALREWGPLCVEGRMLHATMDAPDLSERERRDARRALRLHEEAKKPIEEAVWNSLDVLHFLAPPQVRDAAGSLHDAVTRGPNLGQTYDAFLKAVRRDLGSDTDADEDVEFLPDGRVLRRRPTD